MATNTIISLRPRNLIRQLPWQLDSKVALTILLMLVAFSLVCWIYLTQASSLTTTTYHIDELRLELDQIRNQNAALVSEIAQFEALSRVETRAQELGFRPTTQIVYLPADQYPAIATGEVRSYRGTNPVQGGVDGPAATQRQTVWWIEWLDTIAEWMTQTDA